MLSDVLNINTIILLGFVILSVTVLYILDASIEAPWDTDLDDTYSGPRCTFFRTHVASIDKTFILHLSIHIFTL